MPDPTLLGWIAYAWAAEPFVVSAVGTYVPILLEQVARDNAVWVKDHSIACSDIPPNTDKPLPGLPVPPEAPVQCVVPFFGRYIDTSSVALYTFSLSVLLQTLVVISMSGVADKGHHRKRLLVWFAVLGALTTCMFIFVGQRYYFASLLAILSNACFGAVTVCGNAFLPVLVGYLRNKNKSFQPVNQEPSSAVFNEPEAENEESSEEAHVRVIHHEASKISGMGVAIGYFAALLVQLITMAIVIVTGSTEDSLKLAIFIVGVWWLVFQIPVAQFLKEPQSSDSSVISAELKLGIYDSICLGWKQLAATFKEARQLKDVGLFLVGWFVVSDASTTINSAAVLFARVELQMSAPSLAVIGLFVVCSGIAGATLVPRWQPKLGKNPVNAIMLVIAMGAVIPLYGILGFYFNRIGLNSPWEMYLLALWYGFVLGGLNATARSVFGSLIPPGKETMFFALFSVTDKGSSIIGPVITGLITDHTHNIRYTFFFLLIVMIIPLPVFKLIDVDRGQREADYLATI